MSEPLVEESLRAYVRKLEAEGKACRETITSLRSQLAATESKLTWTEQRLAAAQVDEQKYISLQDQLAASREREGKALETLKNLLFAYENADETGYVTDVGFLDVDATCKTAHELTDKALSPPSDGGRGGWQPIETAPRGQKLIAGYWNACGKWRTVMACYYLPNTLPSTDDWAADDEWAPEGWYEEGEAYCEDMRPLEHPPVLWMPLPEPPSPASEDSKEGECHNCSGEGHFSEGGRYVTCGHCNGTKIEPPPQPNSQNDERDTR